MVLTPAVAAAVKTAKAKEPLPYLLICAFIANAASFVLPISNPANLVIYGSHMPPLLHWLPAYLLPSVAVDRRDLSGAALDPARRARAKRSPRMCRCPILSGGGKTAAIGIAATADRAARRLGVRYPARPADGHRRRRRRRRSC